MKKIEAIIRKSKFDEVKEALHASGIDFFSFWEVTGIGKAR
ncbi:MAG: P-II family nitrogen regulator, partial [Bacteroidota bacterium]